MRRIILIGLLFLTVTVTFGQAVVSKKIKLTNCNATNSCIDCGDIRARFKGTTGDLENYIKNHIDNKLLMQLDFKGSIILQLFVDTLGNPCCSSISDHPMNHLNKPIEQLRELKFDKIISSMPVWTIATTNGLKENSYVMIQIDFINKEKIKVKYFELTDM